MKIALPTKENNQIDAHFGHCEFYTIYTVSENNEITDKQILRSPAGCGCKSNIAFDLSQMDVKMMLAGGLYAIVCAAGSCGVAQERMGLVYFSISSMASAPKRSTSTLLLLKPTIVDSIPELHVPPSRTKPI